MTDPARSTVLVDLDLRGPYDLYAIYDPALGNSRSGDSGSTVQKALVANDGEVASALVTQPAFTATSSGFAGVSDGLTDLLADGRMDWHYASAPAGNLVQTAALSRRHGTLALGFAGTTGGAISAATDRRCGAVSAGFPAIYAYGLEAVSRRSAAAPGLGGDAGRATAVPDVRDGARG